MPPKSRIPRLALDFFTAGLCSYFSYVDAKNGNESLSTAFKYLSGFLFCDGVNNAVKLLYGNTHFVPIFERFKSSNRTTTQADEKEYFEITLDEKLDLEDIRVTVKPWDDDDLVPG